MNENIINMSPLLQKKAILSDDIGYKETTVLGGNNDTESQVTINSSENVHTYQLLGNANYSDFLQKIGVEPRFVGDTLNSYSRQLQESPHLAKSLIPDIIKKNITGNELAFIELFNTLRCNNLDAEALRFIIYAYMKLNEDAEVGENFYLPVISFGTVSKELGATQFAYYLIQQIVKDKNAKRYMSIKMYSTICEYYLKRLENAPWRDKEGIFFTEGVFWASEMISFQKTNEKGYFLLASFLLNANKRDEAETLLRSSIYDPPEPGRDSFARLQCPKCCKLYLEEFRGSISLNQLEEIITKGLRDCIVFTSGEGSEYNEYKIFFQDQLQKIYDVQKSNYTIGKGEKLWIMK